MNWLDKFIVSERGQWDYPGYPTAVPTKNGRITMEGVPYPVMGFVLGQPPVMMQPGKNYKFPGKMVYEIPVAQKGLQTPSDSLAYQLNKIADYEYARGSASGTGLSNFGNPALGNNPTKQQAVNWMMQNTVPIVNPYFTSPTEQAEATDFVYNTGRDPRIYMLDQYLKSIGQSGLQNRGSYNIDINDPANAAKWKTKKSELDKIWNEHSGNISKLSENDRRVLLNKGRDFYYRNINVKPDGSPSDAYYNTWYGRIWNTNDYAPFDPNNPKFTAPRKKEGGHIVPGRYRNPEGNWVSKYASGGDISIPDLSRPNWLEKYQKKGQVTSSSNTKYFTDYNDYVKANQAYQDSLSLYDSEALLLNAIRNKSLTSQQISDYQGRNNDQWGPLKINHPSGYVNDPKFNYTTNSTSSQTSGIWPFQKTTTTTQPWRVMKWTKPTQPVAYVQGSSNSKPSAPPSPPVPPRPPVPKNIKSKEAVLQAPEDRLVREYNTLVLNEDYRRVYDKSPYSLREYGPEGKPTHWAKEDEKIPGIWRPIKDTPSDIFVSKKVKFNTGGWLEKYQGDEGPSQVKQEAYRTPWWNPEKPSEWNPAWTSDPIRQNAQAEFPGTYVLPTVEVTGELTPEQRRKKEEEEALRKAAIPKSKYMIMPSADASDDTYEKTEKLYDQFMNDNFWKSVPGTGTKKYPFESTNDTIINLTDKPMGWFGFNEIPGEQYTDILGNNYVERKSDNEGVDFGTGRPEDTAANWIERMKNPDDTFRNKTKNLDRKNSYYHSKDIPAFYGIEGTKFKVGKASDFSPNTIIVPVRNSTVPYSKVDMDTTEGLFDIYKSLYTYDKDGNKQWNLGNKEKFLVHSPETGQTIFLSSSRRNEKRGDYMKTALEEFQKNNPGAYIIALDEGRFDTHMNDPKGLSETAFKKWTGNSYNGNSIYHDFLTGRSSYLLDPKIDMPIDNDANPNNYGYNLGILKQKYGGWLDSYQGDNKGTQVNNKLSKDAVSKGYTWSDEFGLMAPEVTVKPTISPEAIQSILNREAGMSIAPAPSSFDRRVSQAQYIMANPFDAFGNYVKQGYVPQGNLGNYGMREKSSPVGQLLMDFNPYNWANAGYRAAIRGGDPDTYTTLSGAGNMGADLLEALPVTAAFNPLYKEAASVAKTVGKNIKNLPKATKNELMAQYMSRALDKTNLPAYTEKQILTPRVDPINRSSVNVKNDIVQQYGDDGYNQLMDDLYRQYGDAYDMPLIEFKSSRPNSFFSNVGSGQEAVEGTLFKEKFCLPGSECAKTSNAVTNKVFTEITGLPFAAQENAHNAWHLEDQMTRHGGKNVTEELAQGQLPKVGDRVLMGNDVNQSTFVPGYTADPEVRHAGFVAGYYPNSEGNLVPMIFESGKDSPLFLNPISNTFTGQNSVKQVIRPKQFLDNTFGKGLVDKNIRYAYRDKPSVAKYSSENETVGSLLNDAEQHRESIKRMHDLTNDEFDELLNSLIGIGAQETKLNAALPSGSLPAAKIKLQNTLADMGLTGPIKQTINLAKKTANTLTSKSSFLPKYPGTSFIEMESAKLADAQGIPFSEALKTIKSQYQPKPKFIPSTVEPSKGMFRQKFKTENARTSDFEHHITNDELGHGLSQMAENFSKIKKLYPEATPRQLIDLTTLMWNSPGKAQNKQLVDFYLLGKGNPNPAKFKFDYLNKVNKYKDQLINIHPQSTDSYREIFRAGYPEIQYKKGGPIKWLDKYQGDTQSSQVAANLPWIDKQGNFIETGSNQIESRPKAALRPMTAEELDSYKAPDATWENIAEVVDPTGLLSHDDAKRAYDSWKASGRVSPTLQEELDMFSAVPGLGKYSYLRYLDPNSAKIAFKSIPWQQIVNLFGTEGLYGPTNQEHETEQKKKKLGGWLDKYQVGKEVKSQQNQKYQDAIKWHEDWMNSPMYKQMLYGDIEQSKYPSDETLAGNYDAYYFDAKRKNRLSDLKQTPLDVRSSQPGPGYEAEYSPLYNEIRVYPDGYNSPTVMHHEIRHGIEVPKYQVDDTHFNMPAKDYNYLETLNNNRNFQNAALSKQDVFNDEKIWNRYKDYYTNPSEVNARLAEIRKQAQDQKVYDPFTQPIPNDFFKNFDNRALQELKNYYSDEEIQHMLNHFSYNQTQPNDTGIYQSKLGGKVKLKKYQRIGEVKQNQTPPANLAWINQQGQFTQVPPPRPEPVTVEGKVNKFLGEPMHRAQDLASSVVDLGEDPVDNLRHSAASMYLTDQFGSSLGAAGMANALGMLHEYRSLPNAIKRDGVYHSLMSTAEDLFNNAVGSGIGMLPLPIEAKESLLIYLTNNNMLPDGVSMPEGNMYWKKKKGGEPYPSLGYYEYIGGYSGIFAKGGVSSKKSSWLNKYK